MLKLRLKYLSVFFALISILSFFNVVYSYYFNLYLNLDTYIYSLLLSAFISIIFFKIKSSDLKPNIFEKILTILLGYFLIPIIMAIPFYFSIYNITFINSLFESTSGFTSTGFSIFENIKHIDQSLILWRSSIQWIGGLYFLFSIIFLIDIYDESLKKSLTNFFTFNSSEIIKQTSKIFILYTFLTIFIFIVLNLLDVRTFNSFNLSMTIISSGGFLPVNDISNIINSDIQKFVFSLLMLISYFSIFFIYNLVFFKDRNKDFFYEDYHLGFYLIIVLSIFFIFFSFNNNFVDIFFSVSSSISNIGFSTSSYQAHLSFIFLILVIVGGSFFSTSSGLRFIRIYTLLKFSLNQMLSFSKPRNIFMSKLAFSKINFNFEVINKYFLSILIFIISFFSLTILLSFFNIDFEKSLKLAILTLMNTVNSTSFGLDEFNFNELHIFIKYSFIFFMVIGRIELLTIFLILKKYLFKN